jgi:four helix bundle protein
MKKESVLKIKSYKFALRIVKFFQFLRKEKKEYVLSKQILESGASIGALVREAEFGQSKADFISKMQIALKEANETIYWLHILFDTDYINDKMFQSLNSDCEELIKMLISTVNTAKKRKVNSEK